MTQLTSRLDSWHRVAALDQFPARGVLAVTLDGERLVVASDGQNAFALRDICLHESLPLRRGALSSSAEGSPAITCPYHGWQWDQNGRCVGDTSLPDAKVGGGLTLRRVQSYDVQISDGIVWVRLDSDPETR